MMTSGTDVAIRPRMGRKKRWHDVMVSKFPAGTFERIAVVLRKDGDREEDRTDFVREAVEREIERRERKPPPPRRGGRQPKG